MYATMVWRMIGMRREGTRVFHGDGMYKLLERGEECTCMSQ